MQRIGSTVGDIRGRNGGTMIVSQIVGRLLGTSRNS